MKDFTLGRYSELLRIALDEGYRFVGFGDLDGGSDDAIVLRHDIDFSPRWLAPMAAVEQLHGITSTWCLQPSATTYRWDAAETRAAVRALLEAGHELALHFDANRCATRPRSSRACWPRRRRSRGSTACRCASSPSTRSGAGCSATSSCRRR